MIPKFRAFNKETQKMYGIDGFTDAGVWDDDNHEIIKSLTFRYGGLSNIKGKYRISIEILEMETHDYY